MTGFCQTSCQTRCREAKAEFSLRRFENSEHTGCTTQVKQATTAGRDVLIVAGRRGEGVGGALGAFAGDARAWGGVVPPGPLRAPHLAPPGSHPIHLFFFGGDVVA